MPQFIQFPFNNFVYVAPAFTSRIPFLSALVGVFPLSSQHDSVPPKTAFHHVFLGFQPAMKADPTKILYCHPHCRPD